MAVLQAQDLRFWEENGYVVVHDAVPPENCRAAEQAVWDFLDMKTDDPETWYPDPPRASIMVEMYQHQALWNNRQYPRVHQAFTEIWGTGRLWVSFDRASMNPPERHDFHFIGPSAGGAVHHDVAGAGKRRAGAYGAHHRLAGSAGRIWREPARKGAPPGRDRRADRPGAEVAGPGPLGRMMIRETGAAWRS